MSRGIDHTVHAVRDMSAAAGLYERLGFTLTPLAHHPFGTDNRLALFQDNFVELITVARPDDITQATPLDFSFGGYTRDYLSARQGMSMLALKSDGAATDRQDFEAKGLRVANPFEFSRRAGQPDGTEVIVGFKLTFVLDDRLPEAQIFTCDHQHTPEYFYKPQFQVHANGALAIEEAFLVSENPEQLQPLAGSLDGAHITVLSAAGFDERFPGVDGLMSDGQDRFTGYRVLVDDVDKARKCLADSGVEYSETGDAVWVGPSTAMGTVIEYSERRTR